MLGCSNPVDFWVFGPATDPSSGNQGPLITTGTLEANTPNPDGETVTVGTALVTPAQVGTYTIESGTCDGSRMFPASFEVTSPTTPPPPPNTLRLTPESQSRSVDNSAVVTATLTRGGPDTPVSGAPLTFSISGPNADAVGTCAPSDCVTDANGQVTWTYAGAATGHDTVEARHGAELYGDWDQAGVDWTPTTNGAVFAAVGDSFSAGEGTGDYLDGTDTASNQCHRSNQAYGPLLKSRLGFESFGFVACSGAVTDDLFRVNARNYGEPAQLCLTNRLADVWSCAGDRLPVLGTKTRHVTLTIGGNDAGFGWVVQKCGWIAVLGGNLGVPGAGRNCWSNGTVTGPTVRRLAALGGLGREKEPNGNPIHSLLSTLRAVHAAAPNARVYVAGYPRLFQNKGRQDCKIGEVKTNVGTYDLRMTPLDTAWLDGGAATLNSIIAQAATSAGPWATYVNVANRFAGHGICSSDPWLYPVRATASLSFDNRYLLGLNTASGSLHPIRHGQAQGYEQAFLAAGFPG